MGIDPRDEATVAQFPDGDQVVVVPVADDRRRRGEIGLPVLTSPSQPSEPIEHLEVHSVPLALERVGLRHCPVGRLGQATSATGPVVRFGNAARWRTAVPRSAVHDADLGGREEPLEVAQPVAPIAAWVDPVVAQTPRIAPGPDRVRMNAKKARSLRDG